jgi:ankyrin repeat protein
VDHPARSVEDFLKELSRNPGFEEMPEITVNSRSYLGDTPLHVAAIWGDVEAIRLLVQAGADINALESFGYTPLHQAAEQGKKEAYDLLISLGADVDIKNKNGDTAADIIEAHY